jgi:hypothetical protein
VALDGRQSVVPDFDGKQMVVDNLFGGATETLLSAPDCPDGQGWLNVIMLRSGWRVHRNRSGDL